MATKAPEDFLGQLKWLVERQVINRLTILKLEVAEKMARLAGLMISSLVTGLIGFFVLLFLSLMAGYFFSRLTGSLFLGFGIVAGAYVIFFVWLIVVGMKRIESKVADLIIREIFAEEKSAKSEEEDDGSENEE
jgi:ABC-type glycerol-3-phosphate transport system permease component